MALRTVNLYNFETVVAGPVLSGKKVNTSDESGRPRVVTFVDESGDRNSAPSRSSDHFTMTAVMVEAEHESQLRMQIEGAKSDLGREGATPLGSSSAREVQGAPPGAL